MNLKVFLAFLLLAMLVSPVSSWLFGGRRRRRQSSTGGGSSPAGGPRRNRNAVVCTSYRNRNTLTCRKGRDSATCRTQAPRETRDDRFGGPTPRGEYLIGKRYTNPQYRIDWYNLYPKKEDNSGYYGYTQRTRKGRYAMGLHPGTTSLGCVTVRAPTYNSDPCWQRIRRVIDNGNMNYRRSSYSGFLYVR
ncbi:uncharacterized protein [Montipora foliosa]|uniref:uncharacterized protein n=1 Tax=Montipora foliosa TaxID=591990 RepID=UPI0035F139A7